MNGLLEDLDKAEEKTEEELDQLILEEAEDLAVTDKEIEEILNEEE